MIIFKTIDAIFIVIEWVVWIMGILGIFLSAILLVANISLGLPAILSCLAMFGLSIGLTLIFFPKQLLEGERFKNVSFLSSKRFVIGAVAIIIAIVLMGIAYFSNGGLPNLNLLFI